MPVGIAHVDLRARRSARTTGALMTRRARTWWLVAAALFVVVNSAGALFAAVQGEALHAGTHVALGLLGLYAAWRLSPGRSERAAIAAPAGQYDDRLTQIEESVNAVAIEVERIGEGQRFMTRVLSEEGAPEQSPERAANRGAAEPKKTPPPAPRD